MKIENNKNYKFLPNPKNNKPAVTKNNVVYPRSKRKAREMSLEG